jgi:LemA protein
MLIFYIFLGFVALGGIGYLISLFNSLIQVKNNIGKAWSNIDVLLLQRNEEIPKLIDATKAYGKYERETMEEIVRLRKRYALMKRIDEKTEERISKLEDMIADRRAFFNDTVKIYNVQREQFPQIIFAGMMGYKPHPYLHVPKEERP